METSGWVAVVIAFLAVEGSLFAAWMSLRDRVTNNESRVREMQNVIEAKLDPMGDNITHLMIEGDELREKTAANAARIDVHDQQHRSAESRLRRLENGHVRRDLEEDS